MILQLENLHVRYGGIAALKGIDLTVARGETITLVGSNGAGKTTTMRAIMGLVQPQSGGILFEGEDITKWETKEKVRRGIILAPEGRQIFPGFTVRDNLLMGAYLRGKECAQQSLKTVTELFPRLRERMGQMGGTLSGGEQQMLAIARAMMAKPDLLLLDEPSLGLAPLIVSEVFQMIRTISQMGTTILLVEQNARMALKVSDRAYVLETGSVVLHDTAQNLLKSDMVRKAYLGES